ncbi:hypothetical protein ELH66_08235 [Rhizobium ruizarguesonis]|uniref:hypothetical protein n=1 Tax=Rhizobium ruizarguesonis TaxID=2081791 RepID=UPI00103022E3|nr:hypothetical protein [Rhizobium ruizarguesonis]TBA20983.1 hypothetical protein ELH66_08235 [Rhizobium ruizarguesonis]
MSELEGIFLERFFLEPGSEGTIGSVSVNDDALIEIFGASDLSDLRERFVGNLLQITRLKALLAGEYPPFASRPPDYLRILMFVCWMQTSKVREEDDTDFREMLGRHTGINFLGALMRGLNPMWEHLQAYLSKEHGIDLDLPGIHPHSQIGRTLRIAFPTLRDKAAFKRLRQIIGAQTLLDPVEVSRAVNTTRDLITETMPSFSYNFKLFDRSWKRGGGEYMQTTFWKAWYSFVAEYTALEELLIVRGDFGDHELFRVSPSGERKALRGPEEAQKFVPEPIAKAIRSGVVLMEDLGWGRSRATSAQESSLILLRRSRLAECDDEAIVSYDNINAQWLLANFRNRTASDVPIPSARRVIGWRDGIRVGGAHLGRSPFTPILSLPAGVAATVSLGGDRVAMEAVPQGISFPSGTYSGTATGQANGQIFNILLVPNAIETPRDRRLAFDRFRDIGEDQFHRDTAPSIDGVLNPWPGERVKSCEDMTNIAEALYARTARGLAFVDALEIIRRGLSKSPSAPREWDILRTFADAGWFDLTLVRNFPARKLLQRPTSLRTVGAHIVMIEGPTPFALVERIEAAASAAGGTVEIHHGVSQWALPRVLVRTGDRDRQRDFVERIGFADEGAKAKAVPIKGDEHDAHGYHVVARFEDHLGFFAANFDNEMPQGLYRLERNEGKKPFLYRSIVSGKTAENFASPSIAILAHHTRMRRQLFRYDGNVMVSSAARVSLPSSWAQWASSRTICNAGAILRSGTWSHAYPLGSEEVALLSGLIAIERSEANGTPWIDRFAASASNSGRVIFDGRAGKIRRAGSALRKSI